MDWLASEHVPAVNTKRNYADDLRFWADFAREAAGRERFALGCIEPEHLRTWRLSEKQRGRAGRSINRRLSTLNSLHEFARAGRIVTKQDRVKIHRGDRTTATPIIEVDEFQRITSFCATPMEAFVVILIYTLAGRVTETCEADLTQLHDNGRTCVLDLYRKGGKDSPFTLPPRLCELADVALAGRTTGKLITDAHGDALTRHDVDNLLTRLGHQARVLTCPEADNAGHAFHRCDRCRDVTPHVLRASRLTHMYDANTPLSEIQEFADHSDPATTLGYIERRRTDANRAAHAAAAVKVFDSLITPWVQAA
ncbi:site-specific integrase [Streptomyces noursei]|uniref:tyrosine-type recombinase/integrase n=1 Tax=Streptomyces noursei TaxID=1971 RepID=UPI00344CF8CE